MGLLSVACGHEHCGWSISNDNRANGRPGKEPPSQSLHGTNCAEQHAYPSGVDHRVRGPRTGTGHRRRTHSAQNCCGRTPDTADPAIPQVWGEWNLGYRFVVALTLPLATYGCWLCPSAWMAYASAAYRGLILMNHYLRVGMDSYTGFNISSICKHSWGINNCNLSNTFAVYTPRTSRNKLPTLQIANAIKRRNSNQCTPIGTGHTGNNSVRTYIQPSFYSQYSEVQVTAHDRLRDQQHRHTSQCHVDRPLSSRPQTSYPPSRAGQIFCQCSHP